MRSYVFFLQKVAEILWNYLDESKQQYHQRSVELFNLLHQVVPSSWTCEDVMGQSMVSYDEVHVLKKHIYICCNVFK
jgi:hypothetical protein